MQQHLQHQKQRIAQMQLSLVQLSPKAVLARGYAIVSSKDIAINSTESLKVGQSVQIQFYEGSASADITNKN